MTLGAFAHRDAVQCDEAEPYLRLPTAPETPDMQLQDELTCTDDRVTVSPADHNDGG